MGKIHYTGEKQRLDIYASGLLEITRSQAQKRIKNGEIKINGNLVNPSKTIIQGDAITISEKKAAHEKKEVPKVNIIYEDEKSMLDSCMTN